MHGGNGRRAQARPDAAAALQAEPGERMEARDQAEPVRRPLGRGRVQPHLAAFRHPEPRIRGVLQGLVPSPVLPC